MARPREKDGKVVFIGNIPYGVSEEQICDIFGRIGTVVGFRLVHDKETQKPKGFGFLEYPEADQAAAAVRNLNGFELMGRQLKVDYSNDNSGGKGSQNDQQSNRAPPPAHFDMNNTQSHGMPNGGAQDMPPIPQGTDLPLGLTAADAISKTLSVIQPPQLIDFLSQMKGMVTTDPQKVMSLLQQAPQLSFAICQALMQLGLVDSSIIGSLLQQAPQQQAPAQPPPPQQQQYQQAPPAYIQQQQQPQAYAQQPNPYGAPAYQHPGYAPTPPQQPAYQPPPQQQPVYQQPPPQQDNTQQQLIQTVMAMTREQIFALDENSRNQILALRAQLGAPVS